MGVQKKQPDEIDEPVQEQAPVIEAPAEPTPEPVPEPEPKKVGRPKKEKKPRIPAQQPTTRNKGSASRRSTRLVRRRQLTRNPKKLKQSLNHLYQNRLKSPNLKSTRRPSTSSGSQGEKPSALT